MKSVSICSLMFLLAFSVLSAETMSTKKSKGRKSSREGRLLNVSAKKLPKVEVRTDSIQEADVNCDGINDYAFLGERDDQFFAAVITGPLSEGSTAYSVDLTNLQDQLEGKQFSLSVEPLNYDLAEIFGQGVPGFKKSDSCMGLRVYIGEVDSPHIYFNHQSRELDVWRL